MLAFDVRTAGESPTVGFPEVDIGTVSARGNTSDAPRAVGESAAKDLLVTGCHVDADETVEQVVDDALEDALFDYAETLADKFGLVLSYRSRL